MTFAGVSFLPLNYFEYDTELRLEMCSLQPELTMGVGDSRMLTNTLIDYACKSIRILWKGWPRNMIVTLLNYQQNQFSLRGTCPHGSPHESVFIMVTPAFVENVQQIGRTRLAAVLQCQGCLKLILGMITRASHSSGPYVYEAHYPLGNPDDTVADEIPDHIKPDFREALRCRSVNAYNATVEMCRRAIEASCIHLGANPKKNIKEQIDEIASKDLITEPLRQMAHKIRLGGNRGAHPPEDPESGRPITDKEADAVIKFTTEYFHHVYVMPALLDGTDFSKTPPDAASSTSP